MVLSLLCQEWSANASVLLLPRVAPRPLRIPSCLAFIPVLAHGWGNTLLYGCLHDDVRRSCRYSFHNGILWKFLAQSDTHIYRLQRRRRRFRYLPSFSPKGHQSRPIYHLSRRAARPARSMGRAFFGTPPRHGRPGGSRRLGGPMPPAQASGDRPPGDTSGLRISAGPHLRLGDGPRSGTSPPSS